MRAYCHGNQSRLQPTTLLPTTPCHPFVSLPLYHSDPSYSLISYISAISFSSDEFREKIVKTVHGRPLFLHVALVRSFFSPRIRKEDRGKSSKRSHLSWMLVVFWEKWNLVLHAGRLCWYSLSLIWIYLVPLSVSAVSCTRYEQDLMVIA